MYRTVYREDSRLLTSPDTVARKICREAEKKRSRARCLFGFGARTLVTLRAVLPTRADDRLLRGVFKSKAVQRWVTKQNLSK